MRKSFVLIFSIFICQSLFAQRVTDTDGDWEKQLEILTNTAEADLMIRVGDIDNLGFKFDPDFNPFSGRSTYSHGFPWKVNSTDARGTDRIMVPSSFKGWPANSDGYSNTTIRPGNKPQSISIPLAATKNIKIDSASLQFFIDDFQSPSMNSKFQVKLNGLRFTEAEKMISRIDQTGPIGKLITIRLTPEFLSKLNTDSLVIAIDDPTSKTGDGFAIDFVKLLINPKIIYKGAVKGTVIDFETRAPIANAIVSVSEFGSTVSDEEGNFILENLPAGLTIIKGSAAGYASDEKQADIISEETTEGIELELKKSGKISFNNKELKEGDDIVLNNIQFDVNSAKLKPAGQAELNKLVSLMKQNTSIEILLSGHTSSEGFAILNRELSLKRVRSCKDYLTSNGIDDGRITIKGFGPDRPIAPNDTEANRAKNRRVELKITKL